MQALNESRPVESVADWLAGVQTKADAVAEKFAQVAADLRRELAAEEEAHREVVFQDSHDSYWQARADAGGDEGEEVAA